MSLVAWAKKELSRRRIYKPKSLLPPRTSLASAESLTTPFVQEVVISADIRCTNCQKRIAHMISKMEGGTDSVEVDVLKKKVTFTCRSERQAGDAFGDPRQTGR
ncbi:PREDICTED: uncharacterized protein LOC104602983 [Nelumbo nucifera]|uniref:Uncharacterized protein LOC104602983 n=2 Tax=Nelumbo nucifera TaxID=4432 RepID=A0A1U8AQF1_NELNU|nr:PREDICTED: uncharacterized protein LOC104602983 [Nelumbo nucifera]DAD31757.1 TPA_asm: hypothetical protein HUJ06_010608 [Nelumbo nucifera]